MDIRLITILLFISILGYSQEEKISNGDFSSGTTDWTITGSGFSIADGVASFDGANNTYLKQDAGDMISDLEDSKTYLFSFDINTSAEDEYAYMRIYGSTHTPIYKSLTRYYEGSHNVFITTPASGNDGGMEFWASNTGDAFTIDNISVVELSIAADDPYFIATDGDDTNDGSIANPWATWGRAVHSAVPGDTVYFRSGIYYKGKHEEWNINSDSDLGVDGERGNPISYMGYPPDIAGGDSIVFDCSLMYIPQPDTAGMEADPPTATNINVTGIACGSEFIVFKDFTLRNVYQKRRYIATTGFNMAWSANLRVENCRLYNVSGHGFYYDPGWAADGRDSTIFLNNDAWSCCDSFSINVANYRDLPSSPQAGTWANGFFIIALDKVDPDTSSYVQFIGNRSWHNADEGVNLSSVGTVFAQNNWAFDNGYHLLHDVYDYETSGNGWKVNMGWHEYLDSAIVQYYFYNNIGAFNIGYGYAENGSHVVSRNRDIYNNTMAYNVTGFVTSEQGDTEEYGLYKNKYVNNVAYGNSGDDLPSGSEERMYVNEYNSWTTPPGVTMTNDDFILVNEASALAELTAPRKADNSLPDLTFMKLAEGSDLINAGTDVGIDYNGSAPDLGAFESNYDTRTEMITDGDFSSATNWSLNSSWTISNDSARFDSVSNGFMYQIDADMVSSVEASTLYTLSFDAVVGEDVGRIGIASTSGETYWTEYDLYTGLNSIEFTTPSDIGDGGIRIYGWRTYDAFRLDNLSMIENATIGDDPYYVATDGNDAASGDITHPWKTWAKAFRTAEAGDTVYLRGGTWYKPVDGNITDLFDETEGTINNGTDGNRICFFGYPPDIANGDSVIYDGSRYTPDEPDYDAVDADGSGHTYNTALTFWWVEYLHFKDIKIRNFWQHYRYVYTQGFVMNGCKNNILENISVENIGGIGIRLDNEDAFPRDPDTTYVINCDAYHCIDSLSTNYNYWIIPKSGTWAHGFNSIQMNPADYTTFDGCRAWMCSDDGWNAQGYGGHRYINCWSFLNGVYLPFQDGMTSGNGYKMNTPTHEAYFEDRILDYPDMIAHHMTNSIAAINEGVGMAENRALEIAQNRKVYNNTAYYNEQGFSTNGDDLDPTYDDDRNNEYINNLSYDNHAVDVNGEEYMATDEYNSWTTGMGITITDADFTSVDSATIITQLSASRKSDGSLPDLTVLKLAEGSDLIDVGTDVDLPYNGTAPDLGYAETNYGARTEAPLTGTGSKVMISNGVILHNNE